MIEPNFITRRRFCTMQKVNCEFGMTLEMTKKARITRHVFLWSLFIAYEVAFIHFTTGIRSEPYHFVIFYGLNISLFYFYAHVVLDYAFFRTRKPYLVACLLTLPTLMAYLCTKFLIDQLLASGAGLFASLTHVSELYIVTNLWRGIYFIGLSIAFWSMRYFLHFQNKTHQMETEQLKQVARNLELENRYMEVENAFLQNQISPHILFNSLNFIYSDIRHLSDRAGKGVMLLSELLHYSLRTNDDRQLVELSAEVAQVGNLLELIRLRYHNRSIVRFNKKGRISGLKIIPLSLLTIVENLIKHGELFDRKFPAKISLEVSENKLRCSTVNKIRISSPYSRNGIGLKNLRKRLENTYYGRYNLDVRTVEDLFFVHLVIDL